MLANSYLSLDCDLAHLVAMMAYQLLRQRDLLERRLVDGRRGRGGCCEKHRRLHDGGRLMDSDGYRKRKGWMDG
ncbi:hypothetical protein IG631_11041 [Alternaria alternata]|nr:hypothetical protein IG631_11041 [Alternaria alternata]